MPRTRSSKTNALNLPGLRRIGGGGVGGRGNRLPAGFATSMVRSGVNQAALLWTRTGRGGGSTRVNSQPFSARRRGR